tara:strand:- start:208 stop:339 length:132 start_codon:yes stop_codon:yes gene_type:complete
MFTQEELAVILELVQAEQSWYEQEEDDTQEKVLASIQEKIYNS